MLAFSNVFDNSFNSLILVFVLKSIVLFLDINLALLFISIIGLDIYLEI